MQNSSCKGICLSTGWVCAQPRTDPITSGDRKSNPPLTVGKHNSVQLLVSWIALISVETDGTAPTVRPGQISTKSHRDLAGSHQICI